MGEKAFNIIKCWIKSLKLNTADSPPQKDGDVVLFGEVDGFGINYFGFLISLSQTETVSLPYVSNVFIRLKRYCLLEIQ